MGKLLYGYVLRCIVTVFIGNYVTLSTRHLKILLWKTEHVNEGSILHSTVDGHDVSEPFPMSVQCPWHGVIARHVATHHRSWKYLGFRWKMFNILRVRLENCHVLYVPSWDLLQIAYLGELIVNVGTKRQVPSGSTDSANVPGAPHENGDITIRFTLRWRHRNLCGWHHRHRNTCIWWCIYRKILHVVAQR